jgi:hypothetical protein
MLSGDALTVNRSSTGQPEFRTCPQALLCRSLSGCGCGKAPPAHSRKSFWVSRPMLTLFSVSTLPVPNVITVLAPD